MKRVQAPRWLAPALLAALAVPSMATAQTVGTTAGALTVTPIKIGDKTYNPVRPLNKAECADKSLELSFRVEGLPGTIANPNFLEVWIGTDCQKTTRNDKTNGQACTVLTSQTVVTTDKIYGAFKMPITTLCKTEGEPTLYFLGVKTAKGSDSPSYLGTTTVKIDTVAPSAPTSLHGGSGQTEIPIKWKSASGDVDHYLLIWDEGASNGSGSKDASASGDDGGTLSPAPSECSSDLLFGGSKLGNDLSKLPSGLDGKTIDGKVESTTLDGTGLKTDLAAIAVIAVDLAGNASLVSNVDCIEVVPTTGFWDQYQAEGGDVQEGCACSAPGHSVSHHAAWPAALVLGAVWLRARRRRS